MATANKSTGLQIALVFTVMATIIALVVAFLEYRTATDTEAKLKTATDERTKASSAQQAAATDVGSLKAFLGYPNTGEVGKAEAEGEATVIGQLKKAMTENAPTDVAQPTVLGTIQALGQKVNSLLSENASQAAEVIKLNNQIAALKGEYQSMVDRHEKAVKDAEKVRQDAQASKEKEVEAKEKQLAEVTQKVSELQTDLQGTQQKLVQMDEKAKSEIKDLRKINQGLLTEKEKRENYSFEVPSGQVQWVNTDTKLVWINRGEADALRKGTTFSVYKQINKGVARGRQDIKGAIEVTRIVGPHQAEARITRSENSNPIIPGDPIYTPLWTPGRKESFAIVGLIDIDNDGISDRHMLHELVDAANGAIVDEVDDEGVRHPTNGNIDVSTKFLVIGKIPDYSQANPNDKKAYTDIADKQKKMRDQALEHGVRVVSLEDFLNYIGYEPGRRIWRPGISTKWNLRLGSEGTAARPNPLPPPVSGGTTSPLYKEKTDLPTNESAGTRSIPGK